MRKILLFLPVIIWMAVIFYFSSQSTVGVGINKIDRFLILKSFHLIEYAILSFLFSFALLKHKSTIIISYIYSISDEIHQYYVPGRNGRFSDTLIDLIGILIGVFIFNQLFSFKKK